MAIGVWEGVGAIAGHCGGVVGVLECCGAGAIGCYSGVLWWGVCYSRAGGGVVRVL